MQAAAVLRLTRRPEQCGSKTTDVTCYTDDVTRMSVARAAGVGQSRRRRPRAPRRAGNFCNVPSGGHVAINTSLGRPASRAARDTPPIVPTTGLLIGAVESRVARHTARRAVEAVRCRFSGFESPLGGL